MTEECLKNLEILRQNENYKNASVEVLIYDCVRSTSIQEVEYILEEIKKGKCKAN
jgi:hypothetical protein